MPGLLALRILNSGRKQALQHPTSECAVLWLALENDKKRVVLQKLIETGNSLEKELIRQLLQKL
jgi:hypothetical protein